MILCVENLYCFRGSFAILSKVSFELDYGQIISLHGTNGSGKTTLLKTLAQVIPTEKGKIANNSVGTCFLGHENCLKSDLTVSENLQFWTGIYNQTSMDEEISTLNLKNILDIPTRQLSAGQKRKVSLARLLISKSNLWLLDEPETSLDNNNRNLLRSLLMKHLEKRGSIILATHSPIDMENVLPIDITQFKLPVNVSTNQYIDSDNE